ncbi:probable serine hydrolase [Drosophila rhopaloa]|uniref:AB hydrolase-1 domain-containing protein n=1 Tax=Drosophila rhopaloa TaxID=1041015 RepID=A0ABM5HDY7_DRORH|nr:probable serine hydrolase [Drosophila rhopaloa]
MGTLSLRDFKEVKIPAPWGHIAGRWYGNRQERPILAIHGWLDNLGTFDRLISLLPDYIGVLCIDLPGHGRSSHIQPGMHYAVLDYVSIIPRVMKEYGWSKVSLMGHSLGGIMSFLYTSLAPDTVDMVISLDIVVPGTPVPKRLIGILAHNMEKHLVEEDRQGNLHEPPSYTLSQLTEVLAKGSSNSVTPDLAKHLLHRQVLKSRLYPDRYYFSRDGRVKFYNLTNMDPGLIEEMSKRIQRKPYLIIKGSDSRFVGVHTEKPIAILRQNNPHFEFYEVKGGTHHVHLHAAEECARYIVPFIRHHRPPALTSWSLTGKELQLSTNEKRREQERVLERSQNQLSKL